MIHTQTQLKKFDLYKIERKYYVCIYCPTYTLFSNVTSCRYMKPNVTK
jgi:hypothetical protein